MLRNLFKALALTVWMVEPKFRWAVPKMNGVKVFIFDEVRYLESDFVGPFAVLRAKLFCGYASPFRFCRLFRANLALFRRLHRYGANAAPKLGAEGVNHI